jgi:hypothetical protein
MKMLASAFPKMKAEEHPRSVRASMAPPFLSTGAFMVINPSAASIAMQVMQQEPTQGLLAAAGSTANAALALVVADTSTMPQVSANGMVGSIINTFA